jgi:hypothetical protein
MDFLKEVGEGTPVPMSLLAIRLAVAFVLGFLAAGVYSFACRRGDRRPEASFLATMVLLSLLIALVTVAIGNNVARAFSLVGTLAIVRFRTVVDDTRDTAFVIYAVACGMCAGSGYWLGPLVCAPLVLLATWLFVKRKVKKTEDDLPPGRLVLRLSSAMKIDGAFKTTLDQVVPNHQLVGMSTARGGSAWDATYAVKFPPAAEAYKVVSALSAVEGVQGVEVKSESE